MSKFVHLHVHSEYSLLDGACRIKDLVRLCREYGMDSLAITDHGVLYGVIDFYKECKKNDIKPILGCEVYTAARTRFDKDAGIDSEQGHLVLLAMDNTGYKNLMKIVSLGFTEGFYYKPRIDIELLEKYHEGLIALSACLSGDIPRALLENNYNKAIDIAIKYKNIFGQDNFFIELQKNGLPEQNLVNSMLIKISREIGVPLIATNDAHYLKRENARAHDVLMCIQTASNVNDENRMRFSTDEVYFRSPEEMQEIFSEIPEAIQNTLKVAHRCNVELEFNKLHLPKYDIPGDRTNIQYLRELTIKGLLKRRNRTFIEELSKDDTDRVENELLLISQMGYVDYFLIVWDFIRFAREKGIMVGPGRGSAAGSLVSYCLWITNIDPVKYGLIFERFLNPERVSMPDIDIDFCYMRRQEVIDYVVEKYGIDHVAQIITFGTMAARAAIRDTGRALDIAYAEVDRVAKMIPFQIGMTIKKALELNPELKKAYVQDDSLKELIDTAELLEGMPRHASTHAAGVVITKEPVVEYVPLQKNEGNITTQFTMGILEELGLLKMDFLGLRTLTVIQDSIDLIKKGYNRIIEFDNMEMDDPEVYKMIGDGHTAGVFQLESAGMTQFMKELSPASLEDIIAGISLYRPGPMDQIPRYLQNKKNPANIEYRHPILKNILNVTYGCMVYQEQVMQIVRELGGYSMGMSDIVRRAMSKKKMDVMIKERQNFIYGIKDDKGYQLVKGAVNNGLDEKSANIIFDEMMDFASYAFNKSHAAAYAVLAYQTAWLKKYYPVEFMASILNSYLGSNERVTQYVPECRAMGIDILPPDINESHAGFTVQNKSIRFGLAAVKNVGTGAVKSIIMERMSGGKYNDFLDFCERIDGSEVNKRCFESLIKSGAFDTFRVYRSSLMDAFENIVDSISQKKRENCPGQMTLFDTINNEIPEIIKFSYPDLKEFDARKLLSMEKEMLGMYISGHPLMDYEEEIKRHVNLYSSDLWTEENSGGNSEYNENRKITDGEEVTVAGIITSKKVKTTKSDNMMAFVTVEDLYGHMELIVFPKILQKYSEMFAEENIILVRGRLSIREDEEAKIICEEVKPLLRELNDFSSKVKTNEAIEEKRDEKLFLRMSGNESDETLKALKALFLFFSGKSDVVLCRKEEKGYKRENIKKGVNIKSSTFIKHLKEMMGEENVYIK